MEPNEIIHQTVRLRIMAALNALPAGESLDFTRLKTVLKATDGNLGSHLATLEDAGYVKIDKEFVGKKPHTRIAISHTGRRAFERHVAYLRDVLNGVAPSGDEPVNPE